VEVGDEYREAIRFKPDLAEPHDNLANHVCNQRNLEEAIAEFDRVRDNAQQPCPQADALAGVRECSIAAYSASTAIADDAVRRKGVKPAGLADCGDGHGERKGCAAKHARDLHCRSFMTP
jgi:hypothetical protein